MSFEDMNLDPRLYKALKKLSFITPTPVQARLIPLALVEGKDVLANAPTGSGKTLAFLLPVIQMLMSDKESKAIIIAPTQELCVQTLKMTKDLLLYCGSIKVANLAGQDSENVEKVILSDDPHIIISTPSRLSQHLNDFNMKLVRFLVIDEADLVLSFGYKKDIDLIIDQLPSKCQSFLLSATLTADVRSLEHILLKNPSIVEIQNNREKLVQSFIECSEKDKLLILFSILKLKLIKGKILMFTNGIDRGFKVKLFLEQFGIKSCILNGDLPQQSRHHTVEEFNRGLYDLVIAAEREDCDSESGVSRGLDFKHVDYVVNIDFPYSETVYTHRIGRTARGEESGTALSFVTPKDRKLLKKHSINKFSFDVSLVEGFRYRVEDASMAIGKNAIKEARIKELKFELVNNEKLKSYFENKPQDFNALRHDKPLHTFKVQPHLKKIPSYLMPTRKIEKCEKVVHKKIVRKVQDPLSSISLKRQKK